MIYPINFEEKCGFSQIRKLVEGYCFSNLGKEILNHVSFLSDYETIKYELNCTEEFLTIITVGENFPSNDYIDVKPELKRLSTPGTFIEPEKLYELYLSYTTILDVLNYLEKFSDKYPSLKKLADNVITYKEIITEIHKILDEKGNIRDNASPELLKIRTSMRSLHHKIEQRIQHIFKTLKSESIIAQEIEITMRNGRCVIPVNVAHKRKIKGYIHDESATGQTVYIEPAEIFEMNNQLRELENNEKKEIVKILTKFTDYIRPLLPDIIASYDFLGKIDFIRAKATLASETNSVKPYLLNDQTIEWSDAKNPLLLLHFKEKQKEVIPNDINLNHTQRIMVVSGPNAGGKSVLLKTICLLQYMLQCGFLIPVREGSVSGIFKKIFIEIGDEQSIENDLSTYTSHLLSLKFFVENADNLTLFLIDEFGSGTDPNIGGAIAEAVLETLNQKKSFGVITTHYTNLKEFAASAEGVFNAAMLFDPREMKPLFKLETGITGNSFALEIADKIGLQKDIIEKASDIAGKEKIIFDKQLQQFLYDKNELEKKKTEIEIADQLLSEVITKYQNLKNELESKSSKILQDARNEALALIENANKTIENVIKQIKEAQAEKEKTKTARRELQNLKNQLSNNTTKPPEKSQHFKKKKLFQKTTSTITKTNETPSVGSFVIIAGQKAIGEITHITEQTAHVIFGEKKISIPLSMLETTTIEEYKNYLKNVQKSNVNEFTTHIQEKIGTFTTSLDIRGMRADEAALAVEKFIDDALLLKIHEIKILHGKGSGILRKVVREILSKNTDVKSFSDEKPENGGDGITVIQLF